MNRRVTLLKPDIILYDELPVQTLESLENMFKTVFELAAGLKTWFLVVDIRKTEPPSREIRTKLQEIYAHMPGLQHVFLITDMSRLLALVVRFVAGRSIKIPYSTVKDLDAALKLIKDLKT